MNCPNCYKKLYTKDENINDDRMFSIYWGRTLCLICRKGCVSYTINNSMTNHKVNTHIYSCCHCRKTMTLIQLQEFTLMLDQPKQLYKKEK